MTRTELVRVLNGYVEAHKTLTTRHGEMYCFAIMDNGLLFRGVREAAKILGYPIVKKRFVSFDGDYVRNDVYFYWKGIRFHDHEEIK